MILILHIVIALSSIVVASYAYMRPSMAKLNVTYGFIAATLASGTYLVMIAPAHMIQACVSGMVYLAIVGVLALSTRSKLVRSQNTL